MADTIETRISVPPVELNRGIRKTFFETLFATGGNKAHRIDVPLVRDGKAVSLSGAQADGFFTPYAGNKTIHCSGTVSGSTVSVTLDKSCYTQTGPFAFVIQVTLNGVTNTVFWGESSVFSGTAETIIDGNYMIYDLPELLKRIAAMDEATTAAQAATTNANTATANADTAAASANNAAKKIDSMTVQVSGLEAGAAPTAKLTETDGHYHLAFGVPKGNTGATGPQGDTPYIGNNGNWFVGSADTGVKAQGPKGQDGNGSGTVRSVCGVESDEYGNVALTIGLSVGENGEGMLTLGG